MDRSVLINTEGCANLVLLSIIQRLAFRVQRSACRLEIRECRH
jgi:hypothetical protein